jgi:hypothetical protein
LNMDHVTRRSFLSRAAAGMTALGLLNAAPDRAEAQLVWKTSDWKLADFQKIVHHPAQIKQLFDVVPIGDGKFLGNVKNSLTALRFGFGVPEQQIKIVAGLHGPANLLNYDDFIWNKYQIGEWLNVIDPETGKPAVRNLFYKSKTGVEQERASKDPDDLNSIYQYTSMEALQERGVQFMSCHTALEEQVRALIRHSKLSQAPEEIVREMLAHTVPGTLVVASMVAAIAILQAEGRYTYIKI